MKRDKDHDQLNTEEDYDLENDFGGLTPSEDEESESDENLEDADKDMVTVEDPDAKKGKKKKKRKKKRYLLKFFIFLLVVGAFFLFFEIRLL